MSKMTHFMDSSGGVHGFSDEDMAAVDNWKSMTKMNDAQFAAWCNPPKTPEQIREEAKQARADSVARIQVTTQAGNTFDGDEVSQGRMARAVVALSTKPPGTLTTWILADNSEVEVDAVELTEALALAGTAQTELWVIE